jgi:hypothetical protein
MITASPPGRARRHDNVLRGVADAVDFHHASASQLARAPQQVNATALQPVLLVGQRLPEGTALAVPAAAHG